jgi:hypothetical protein
MRWRGGQLYEHADYLGQRRSAVSGEAGRRFVCSEWLGNKWQPCAVTLPIWFAKKLTPI